MSILAAAFGSPRVRGAWWLVRVLGVHRSVRLSRRFGVRRAWRVHRADRVLRARGVPGCVRPAVLLLVVGFVVLVPAAASRATSLTGSASYGQAVSLAVPGLGPDCKGDPPVPLSPYGLFTAKPSVTSDGDPFTDPETVSIQSVYGVNYGWWTYDNGCAAGSDILPGLATNIATLIGFQIPGLAPSWGQALMSAVVDPSWTTQLDQVVVDTSQATTAGVWTPWLGVMLLVVAVITLVRAARGALPSVVTGLVWSLVVLVVASWTISYPKEATDLLDQGIQTAVVSTAMGFSGEGTGAGATTDGTLSEQAKAGLDHEWDVMVRSTLYRSWLQGAFGNADSKTAATYGPQLFEATHFSWSQYDTYTADPNGQGKAIVEAKANQFRQVADTVQAGDPVAYQSFTGNSYWDRIGIGFMSLVETIVVAWFLLVAAGIILLSYLLARVVVPIAPAAGVFFLLEPLRNFALGWLRRIAGLLIMGPLFFLAALVVGRFNSAIMGSDLNPMLKLMFIGAVAVLAWKLLRPTSMLGKVKIPGLAAVGGYLGGKHGVKEATEQEQRAVAASRQAGQDEYGDAPVYVGSGSGVARRPSMFDQPLDDPIVYTASRTDPRGERAGTFAPRGSEPLVGASLSAPISAPGAQAAAALEPSHRPALGATAAVGTAVAITAARNGSEESAPSDAGSVDTDHEPLAAPGSATVGSDLPRARPGDAAPDASAAGTSGANSSEASSDVDVVGASGLTRGSVYEGQLPSGLHVANETYDANGRRVFEVYNPERDGPPSEGSVVYGT